MGRRIREFDWSRTPLGPIGGWPHALKIAVRIMLTSRQPIWIGWGEQLTYLYNDPYKSIIGGKHPQALGQPTALVWREIWDDIAPMLSTAMGGHEGTYVEAQLLIMERNGYPEETYYTFSYSPIPDDDGRPGGIICANTDDTQRVIGERQLALLRELAARTADARTWQDACERSGRALGSDPQDLPFALIYIAEPDAGNLRLAGASGIEPGHPAAPNWIASGSSPAWPLADVLRGQEARLIAGLEAGFDLPAGAWPRPPHQAAALPIHATGETGRAGVLVVGLNPFRLFDDGYHGFLGLVAGQIAASIANAQAYEQEKQRAETLAELDRAKTAFFSNVSHEFRTPLTLMLGPVEDLLFKSHTDLSPAAAGQLEVVNRNGLRLLRLVNTLLDFSRIEAGRVRAVYQSTDLATFTAELASVFRAAVERAGLRLIVDCPPLDQAVYVDREMWEKVVLNLLSNAFKFTFEGEIEVSLRQVGGAAELRVRDTGTGIPAEEMPRLFERFHRVENVPGRTHEGSGIGLALVQELVKLHGGSVSAESVVGRGTTFTVTLPLGSGHLPADQLGQARSSASTGTGAAPFVEEALRWLPQQKDGKDGKDGVDGKEELLAYPEVSLTPHRPPEPAGQDNRPRVLVADDNADMRQYVARVLSEHYAVDTVPDGAAALASAGESLPDLVLTDVMMPRLDGFGLLRELRADPRTRELPVIMLSARAGEESRVEGMGAGADDYLVKPFSARELVARVTAHLQMARLRREAGESLRESEERYRLATRATHDVVWDWDMAKDQVVWSESLHTVFGYPQEQAGAVIEDAFQWWTDHIHPQDRERVGESFQRVTGAGESEWVEDYRFLRADGSYAEVTDAAFIVFDREGKPCRIVGAMTDVTERNRAERLQAADNKVLQLILSGSPLPQILEALMRETETQSSQGMLCSVLLVDEGGTRLRQGAAPSLPQAYNQAIDGIVIGPGVGSCGTAPFERRPVSVYDVATDPRWADFKDLAARHRLGSCYSTPIFSSRGGLLGTIAMYYRRPQHPSEHERQLIQHATQLAAIVIERKRAEDDLRRRTAQFETLLNEAPLGVYLVDGDFRIAQVNPTALQAFGPIPELIGRSFDEVIHILWPQPYADEVVGRFRHTLETGQPYSTPEHTEQRLDRGVTEYYEWQIHRIQLPEGGYGVVCYFRDIAERVLARVALLESEERLRQAAKMEAIGRLAGGIAHDFNNQLHGVSGFAKFVAEDPGLGPKSRQDLEEVQKATERMAGLTRQLLAFSRQQFLQLETLDLNAAVTDGQLLLQRLIGSSIEMNLQLAPEPLWIQADPAQLLQVLMNLTINARDAMPEGGHLTLRTARRHVTGQGPGDSALLGQLEPGSYVELAVTDSGVGIMPEHLPHIFEPFFTTKEVGQGTGLGLATVHGIVAQSHGQIRVESTPGQGATFTILLPPAAAESAASAGPVSERSHQGFGPARLLVVDDEDMVRSVISRTLRAKGYEVLEARNGRQALECLAREQGKVDALVSDVVMPILGGKEFGERLAQEYPGLTVIWMSGYPRDSAFAGRSVAEGAPFLQKPVSAGLLLETVRGLLARRSRF